MLRLIVLLLALVPAHSCQKGTYTGCVGSCPGNGDCGDSPSGGCTCITPSPPANSWRCISGQCQNVFGGIDKGSCLAACTPSSEQYSCIDNQCQVVKQGGVAKSVCEAVCGKGALLNAGSVDIKVQDKKIIITPLEDAWEQLVTPINASKALGKFVPMPKDGCDFETCSFCEEPFPADSHQCVYTKPPTIDQPYGTCVDCHDPANTKICENPPQEAGIPKPVYPKETNCLSTHYWPTPAPPPPPPPPPGQCLTNGEKCRGPGDFKCCRGLGCAAFEPAGEGFGYICA